MSYLPGLILGCLLGFSCGWGGLRLGFSFRFVCCFRRCFVDLFVDGYEVLGLGIWIGFAGGLFACLAVVGFYLGLGLLWIVCLPFAFSYVFCYYFGFNWVWVFDFGC